jgi:hypothetical protein
MTMVNECKIKSSGEMDALDERLQLVDCTVKRSQLIVEQSNPVLKMTRLLDE